MRVTVRRAVGAVKRMVSAMQGGTLANFFLRLQALIHTQPLNPFLPKMSIFVHQFPALQLQANPSEKFLQKHNSLFSKLLYRSMMVAKPRKISNPYFFRFKKKTCFFMADFRKKINFLTRRRLKIWVAYTKSGLPRPKS